MRAPLKTALVSWAPSINIIIIIVIIIRICCWILTFLSICVRFCSFGNLSYLPPGVLVSEFWVILFTLVEELGGVALSLNSLTCLFDCSKALQIFTALSGVKLSSLRSNSWSFPVSVKTLLSLNIRSFFRKLHAAALVFSSVRNLSNSSWYGMFQNLWDSVTSLSRRLQYLSNVSKSYRVYLYCHHLSK